MPVAEESIFRAVGIIPVRTTVRSIWNEPRINVW